MKNDVDNPEKNLTKGKNSTEVKSLNVLETVANENIKKKKENLQDMKKNVSEMKENKKRLEEKNRENEENLRKSDQRIEKLDKIKEKVEERSKLEKEYGEIVDKISRLKPDLQKKQKIIEEKDRVSEKITELNGITATHADATVEVNLVMKWEEIEKLKEKLQSQKTDDKVDPLEEYSKKVATWHNQFTDAKMDIQKNEAFTFYQKGCTYTRNEAAETYGMTQPGMLGVKEGQTKNYINEPVKEEIKNSNDFREINSKATTYESHIKQTYNAIGNFYSQNVVGKLRNIRDTDGADKKSTLKEELRPNFESFIKESNGLLELAEKLRTMKIAIKDYWKKVAVGHAQKLLQDLEQAYVGRLNQELENIAAKEEEDHSLQEKKEEKKDTLSQISDEIQTFLQSAWIQGTGKQLKTIKDNKERIKKEQKELPSKIEQNQQVISNLEVQIQALEQEISQKEKELEQKITYQEKGETEEIKEQGAMEKTIEESVKQLLGIALKNTSDEIKNELQDEKLEIENKDILNNEKSVSWAEEVEEAEGFKDTKYDPEWMKSTSTSKTSEQKSGHHQEKRDEGSAQSPLRRYDGKWSRGRGTYPRFRGGSRVTYSADDSFRGGNYSRASNSSQRESFQQVKPLERHRELFQRESKPLTGAEENQFLAEVQREQVRNKMHVPKLMETFRQQRESLGQVDHPDLANLHRSIRGYLDNPSHQLLNTISSTLHAITSDLARRIEAGNTLND